MAWRIRISTTNGWVFGAFVYDGKSPGMTPWDRFTSLAR
jgi:hypothetical protein